MRQRRWLVIASAFILVAIAGFVVLQHGPLAQPPPPGDTSAGGPPPDMPPDPGMMGPDMGMDPGMGMGMGPAAGGSGLEWQTTPPPEDKSMTYREFCNRTGSAPNVPKQFTVDDDGEEIIATKNSWSQLQRVYAIGVVGVGAQVIQPGRVGKKLTDEAVRRVAYDYQVAAAMRDLYLSAANAFTFKVSYPVTNGNYQASGMSTSQVGPSTMSILVIMQVRPSFQKSFGRRAYDRLKKFDCRGYARSEGGSMTTTSVPFSIHTFQNGFYRPHIVNLSPTATPFWALLWGSNEVELSIKNRTGDVIYTARQSAGQGPTILSEIINPPQLYYNPKWKLLIPPEDLRFDGGRLNLNGTRGWAYMFSVDLPPNVAIQMHSASAQLITLDEQAIEARVRDAVGTSRTPTTGVGPGAGMEPGMPGDPAMPGGPGMPPDIGPEAVPPPPM